VANPIGGDFGQAGLTARGEVLSRRASDCDS
jgi:hypothetical protein